MKQKTECKLLKFQVVFYFIDKQHNPTIVNVSGEFKCEQIVEKQTNKNDKNI